MSVLFVFVDGVGAGAPDPERNPLARGEFLLSRFADGSGAPLPAGGRGVLADATLGVPGRPQSATGQTAILTGENAPALVGRHVLGFPNAALRELLRARSLFKDLAAAGRSAAFANAYPAAYLRALGHAVPGTTGEVPGTAGTRATGDAGDARQVPGTLRTLRGTAAAAEPDVRRRRARAAATTVAFGAAGGRFRTWADARAGEALTHDITGRRAATFGADLPERSPAEGAAILARIAAAHDLTLFEFFETDEAGHARAMDRALEAVRRLDAFLRVLVARLGPEDALIVASDHGNLEDLSTRNHTRAPVPVLGFGRAAAALGEVRDLTHLAPMLLRLASVPGTPSTVPGTPSTPSTVPGTPSTPSTVPGTPSTPSTPSTVPGTTSSASPGASSVPPSGLPAARPPG